MAIAVEDSNVFYRGDLKRKYPVLTRGEGIYIYDQEGNKYIDAVAGIAVANVGFGVKEIVDAVAKQSMEIQFLHTSFFTTEVQEKCAKKIIEFLAPPGLTKVWFSLSGTEATETALKLTRQYHLETGNPNKYKVISRRLSYHGSTLGALSVGTAPSWRSNYVPYLFSSPTIPEVHCYRCPYGQEYPGCGIICAHELEKVIKQEGSQYISAFIAEPIVTGSGGIIPAPPEYFEIIRSICDKYHVLFIDDETFTGVGRTGKGFAIDHWAVVPDIIATAKGLGGGYAPIGATIVSQKIFDAILNGSGKFQHGLTFSGNPVSCAAGLATLEYLEKNRLIERSAKMGAYFLQELSLLSELPMVGEINGKGLLLGMEFVKDKEKKTPFEPAKKVSRKISGVALKKGLRVQPGSGSVDTISGDHIIMAPPFIIKEAEIDQIVNILRETISEVEKEVM